MFGNRQANRISRSLLALGAVALLLTVAACGSSKKSSTSASSGSAGSSSSSSKGPIVIGQAGAQTGFMKIYDGPLYDGMRLAAQQINAKGGLLGGRKIEIIRADSQTSLSQARVAAQRLTGQGAAFIVPSCDYDLGGPAAQVANQKKEVAITCAGGPLFGFQGSGPLTFNVFQGSPTEGAVDADFAVKQGWKTAYLLNDTSLAYTKDVCSNFAKRFAQDGGKVLGQATMQNTDASVSSQVSKLRSSGAQMVELCSYPPGGVTALRQIRSAGVKSPIIGAGAFDGTYWTKTVPGISDFYIAGVGSLNGDDPDPARNQFIKDITAMTGAPPTSALYPMSGYEAIQTLADGITQAKSTDGPAVAKALETFNNKSLLLGPTTYGPKCHVPVGRQLLIMKYVNGKESYLTTIKAGDVPDKTC